MPELKGQLWRPRPIDLGWADWGTLYGSLSLAALMLASEPEGIAIDFSDASISIKDLTTPANAIESQGTVSNGALVGPGAKIIYTSPSPKLCKKADGTYGYRAHNLNQRSNSFSSDWNSSDFTLTTSQSDPYGGNAATKLVTKNATSISSGLAQGTGATNMVAGTAHRIVIRCKEITGNAFPWMEITTTNPTTRSWVNLNTGATGTVNHTSVTPVSLNNGWWEFVVITPVMTGSSEFYFTPRPANSNSASVTGDGASGFYATRVQYGKFPCETDYIETTGAPLYDLPYDWTGTYYYPLVEPAATNLFLNNRAAVTQNVSVTAQAYTLSFFGTGTITLSGASTAGPLVGTGANDRVSLTFTPSAGTLTLTVSGTMDLVQIETGTVATSPIITAGATVTRGADQPTIPTSAFPNVQAAITLYAEAIVRGDQSQGRFIQIDDGTSSEAHRISRQGADTAAFSTTDGGSGQSNIIPGTTGALAIGATIKAAYAVQANSAQAAVNGTLGTEDTSLTMPTTTTLRLGHANGGGSQLAQHIKRVMVLPRRMSNAALITLTGGTPTVLQKEDALSIQLNSGDEIAVSSDINRLSDADLDGTEWVVVVQDGVTKKASVETLKDYLS